MVASRSSAEEAAGKRDECRRDSGKAEINKNPRKNKCRVDKLNSRSSHGIFEGCRIVCNENKMRIKMECEKNEFIKNTSYCNHRI